MNDFDEVMAREQRRIEALKLRQSLLQDQIHATEAYMRWCVTEHMKPPPKGEDNG